MHIALLAAPLTLPEITQLTHEFPQFVFLSYDKISRSEITEEHWRRAEILFSASLSAEELEAAPALRWIHCPTPSLKELCLPEIQERDNLLLTAGHEENSRQVGEFVMGACLNFEKNLFYWKQANLSPSTLWTSRWGDTMQTLSDKTFVQIGFDAAGIETARRARQHDMKVISIDQERSFHPHCHKNLSIKELHSVLHQADIVSVNLTSTPDRHSWFGLNELKLMKAHAILVIIGPAALLNTLDDSHLDDFKKLRGCLIDTEDETLIPANSKLWTLPQFLVTPGIAARPKTHESETYHLFRNNLRNYIRDNFLDMRFPVKTALILDDENENP